MRHKTGLVGVSKYWRSVAVHGIRGMKMGTYSFLRTIGRTRGTNSYLTFTPRAFDDSVGGRARYVRLVEQVARSHIHHLLSNDDLQLFHQIVSGHEALCIMAQRSLKRYASRQGRTQEDGFHPQQETPLSVMPKIRCCYY